MGNLKTTFELNQKDPGRCHTAVRSLQEQEGLQGRAALGRRQGPQQGPQGGGKRFDDQARNRSA
ncbi:hypothetical protein [Bacilliculturomica massiliensis]|uniref:hypothetical protein n=1 Tax=Bacilliculturomica massiliensis TaxID=1917867 RepID=UPI00102F37F7|nr:hypothetical protein [Bacilliculturomica massiliensis]